MEWDLLPGDSIVRKELHDRWGGGRQGGISPCSANPNVLIFSDPQSGEQHGYSDGWSTDGVFEYTGEGQQGDQQMLRGNRAIVDHRATGKTLRLFFGSSGTVRYEGEFQVDEEVPFVVRRAPSSGGGPERNVFVFRLQPTVASTSSPTAGGHSRSVVEVPIAQQNVEQWRVTPRQAVTASAVEASLVLRYQRHLEAKGDTVVRHRYTNSGPTALYCDVFNETRVQLVEAKGSTSRQDIRMAIGQLLDYALLETSRPALGLLLPAAPPPELLQLLRSIVVTPIWPHGKAFLDDAQGGFV